MGGGGNEHVVRLNKRQVWHIKHPIYLSEIGFIIQPTTGGLLWCAVNIWVALPIKASAFFLCLIYCHSSSAQTASWNLCQSSNDTVFVIWNHICRPLRIKEQLCFQEKGKHCIFNYSNRSPAEGGLGSLIRNKSRELLLLMPMSNDVFKVYILFSVLEETCFLTYWWVSCMTWCWRDKPLYFHFEQLSIVDGSGSRVLFT